MAIVYFDHEMFDFHHTRFYERWSGFEEYRPGESAWLVPGTDPDDCFYGLE
jgi:hypothetical protein